MNLSGMPRHHTSTVPLWPVWLRLCCCGLACRAMPAPAQALDQAQDQFRHGRYEEVIAVAQSRVEAYPFADEWRVLLTKALLTVGRYDDAYANARSGLDNRSSALNLWLLARQAALFRNDVPEANRLQARLQVLIQRHSGYAQDGENLVALGRALLLLGVEPKVVLENCYRRAELLDPPPRDAFAAAGDLALDKHDFALAADAFRAGLKRYPDDADLEYGLARSFETGNRSEMLDALRSALAGNPRHIPSLLLMADHLIDAEQYEEAEKQLDRVLQINPRRPEALAYRAVLATLRNDTHGAERFRAAALDPWKTNPEVDYLLGQKLARKYRFEEGAAAQRRALAFDPDYLPARRELAEDLLRLGQDAEGWKLAQEAHHQDNYDVTAYNLVTLRDVMAQFQTLTNTDFVLRMAPLEAQLYGSRVLDLLVRARKTLCAKYGIELDHPTTVEIFPEQKDFAVRTFGVPDDPGYLGVCFGSVITAKSPASQSPNPANWEDVLWHEFCHVVTLTATRNRMPRWLSEGISVYEERQANPAWGQSMNLAYRRMILDGATTPLGKLSGAFLAPKSPLDLQFAYYESSLVIEFLVQRFGFDTLKAILSDLREGQQMNQCLAARTLPLPELEKQFSAFVRERAERLAPGVDLETPPAGSPDALAKWAKAHPNNYSLKMRQARDLIAARRWNEAKPILAELATMYAGESGADNPLWLLAVTERNLGETNAETAALENFARQESDFPDLFVRLIEISEARKDWPAATRYADCLLAINPLIALPYKTLAEAGVRSGNTDQAIAAYRKLLLLDPPDPVDAHFQLARLLHARGNADAEAKRQVLMALEDAPRFRAAQELLLELQPQSTAAQTNP
jgi:tetratricopeptide (TPR) repeat protein